ncbi:hypothetical protein BDR03DRAFT_985653 [Suillus americanus]|nr:hypothetical protein BDR03DRAFT_985653 [Suillus americanus]
MSTQPSSWVGFHVGIANTDNVLTPSVSATPGPSSASDIMMASLEDALDHVEFDAHPTTNDNNNTTMHAEPGTSFPPVAPFIPISIPPQSSKGKSLLKLQHLSMPSALEGFGGKMADSIANATTAFQEMVSSHFVEPIPLRKQKVILQITLLTKACVGQYVKYW